MTMFYKSDIENVKKKLEQSIGKNIVFRYNYSKSKKSNKYIVYEGVIENVYSNVLVLRKFINGNIGLIESYTFMDILSGLVEIVEIK